VFYYGFPYGSYRFFYLLYPFHQKKLVAIYNKELNTHQLQLFKCIITIG
jgi:hypothetical protein